MYFSMILGGFEGVSPRTRVPGAGIVRHPKPRIFKDKPSTTGLVQAHGQGQAQAQGQG